MFLVPRPWRANFWRKKFSSLVVWFEPMTPNLPLLALHLGELSEPLISRALSPRDRLEAVAARAA